ncbi:hypothetical protein HDV02_005845, partial [Globomyces sp. JEL0801]
LTEQKRQTDVQYLRVLRNIRSQTTSNEDFLFLRQKCLLPPLESFDLDTLLKTPVIVSSNELRYIWNRKYTKLFAKSAAKPITYVEAMDIIDCDVDPLILAVLKQRMPDYLQHVLHLVIGMPVMFISRNLYKKLGVVNGGTGILSGVICSPAQVITALQVYIPPQTVDKVWTIEGLPPNNILLKRVSSTETITLSCGKRFRLRRNQFPITEAFAITDYKSQGQTFPFAIINLADGKGVSTYIKLSRTKNASNTFLMDGFRLRDLQIEYPEGYDEWRSIFLEPGIFYTNTWVEQITLFD